MSEVKATSTADAPSPAVAALQELSRLGPHLMPFLDAASDDLPLKRLLRLSLFQVSVGMAAVLLTGTLNRVMIVEMGVSSWLVSLVVALPLVSAPLRALIGFRSDEHKSILGWRRTPYLWFGSLLQFGGLAIMPFALILMSGDTTGPYWVGPAAGCLAFLMVGAGMHTVQTAGLALATDIAPEEARPRVVALLYVMLLVGMAISALAFGLLLSDFSQLRLIQLVQGAAALTLVLNLIALWGQEVRDPALTSPTRPRPRFAEAWASFANSGPVGRVLLAVGLGTAAFSMQDVLLEPYGGQVLGLGVGATTALTALQAGGALAGFALAARFLSRGADPYRLAAYGALAGMPGFSALIFAAPLESAMLFRFGVTLIGFGGGVFAVGALTAAMALAKQQAAVAQRSGQAGLALGAWGAVQASAMGGAIALGGAIRDLVNAPAMRGDFGPQFVDPALGYSVVYHIEILLLFATLVAIGPLARLSQDQRRRQAEAEKFGLSEFPG
ncbi:MAG: BCD family MFS transporter [Rhodobacteraceae bacterium]|nr:BCD family MFS transporter [Paracoccaceae bacterium]